MSGRAPRTSRPDLPALRAFLRSLGVDPRGNPEFRETAALTAAFLAERTAALRTPIRPIRGRRYAGRAGETVALEDLPVYGLCPHHLVPFFGQASVRYIPDRLICGVGSLARIVRDFCLAPRLQENLTQAIADAVEEGLQPRGVEVVVRARQLCLEMRGQRERAVFVTEARRGATLRDRKRS